MRPGEAAPRIAHENPVGARPTISAISALHPPDPPLADGVVVLRPLGPQDATAVERALVDPEITRWFDSRGLSARDVVDRARARWEGSEAAEFAIVDDDECVGSIWLNLATDRRAVVGYWLLPAARGKGLATRAVLLVARWAFGRIGVERIGLLADPRNESSVRVAERAGFKREGVLRSWTDVNGERVDHVSFSLLRIDLAP
jgi:RimJ/RimL family protein N-acetyltransferase